MRRSARGIDSWRPFARTTGDNAFGTILVVKCIRCGLGLATGQGLCAFLHPFEPGVQVIAVLICCADQTCDHPIDLNLDTWSDSPTRRARRWKPEIDASLCSTRP